MSATKLPRQLGVILRCDGTDTESCCEGHDQKPAKFQTANIVIKWNRKAAKEYGWGRGLRKNRKRRDLCPKHMGIERELLAQEQAKREEEKKKRDANRKAKFSTPAGEPSIKDNGAARSPQVACEQYLPDPSPSAA